MSNIVHKVKDALSGNKDHHDTTGSNTHASNPNYYESGSTNAGPHNSNIANKVDPRVDSDRDGSYTAGNTGTTGTHTHGTHATHGTHGTHGTGMTGTGMTGTGNTSGFGPHDSSMANRMDPRVDSTTGASNTGTMGTGMGTTGSGFTHSTNAGPHDSNVANKLDPRVDSDRDGSRTMGAGTGTGTYGSTGYGSTGYDSTGTGMTGSHNKTTAGPHKSDMANKLDPRVDSDLDGSRTIGSGPKYGNH